MDNWKPLSVSGVTYTKFGNRGVGEGGWGHSDSDRKHIFDVDDFSTALIKMSGGATVQLNISWVAHQEMPNRHDVELFGTEAGASTYPAKLYRFGKKKGEYEVVSPQGVPIAKPGVTRQADWLDAILKRSKPLCTLKQALVVQKILDGIYLSSKTGKEVRLS
jgi:predicted dehydrogenase